jgi:UDP-N-acetyl-D-mannosaminuronic acid dehydrogenase
MKNKLTVVGGVGHIGLPLSVVLANKGFHVLSYDINTNNIELAKKGKFHFFEKNGNSELKRALKTKRLDFTDQCVDQMKGSDFILTVGTPVDNFLNPDFKYLKNCIDQISKYLISNKQIIILRSTVCPGATKWLKNYLILKKINCDVAFCHERVIQGHTFEEISKLPQIIAGTSLYAVNKARKIFSKISKKILICSELEAEFAKLYSNVFRYIQFAISNEFYMLADKAGVNFHNIRKVMTDSYPRAQNLPSPGFAAGPCLFKDTMQLVSHSQNSSLLSFNAMLVNEGLILYLVNKIKNEFKKNITIGILGMAFKADNDDARSSLSYKLKKILEQNSYNVICSDPYVSTDKDLKDLKFVIKKSDLIIIATPHTIYKRLKLHNKRIIDVWGIFSK